MTIPENGRDLADDPMSERVTELLGERSDLEVELVHDIVTSFQTRSVQLLTQLGEALTDGDAEGIRLHAHTLVGAGLNLGAEDIATIGRQIEADAKTGSVAACLENLPMLMAAVEAARTRLGQLSATLPPVSANH